MSLALVAGLAWWGGLRAATLTTFANGTVADATAMNGNFSNVLDLRVPVVTAWQSFSIVTTNTNTFQAGGNWRAHWRRVGQNMEISIHGATNLTEATLARIELPAGATIDYSQAELGVASNLFFVGEVVRTADAAHNFRDTALVVGARGTNTIQIYASSPAGAKSVVDANWGTLFNHADRLSLTASVPIVGWAATEQLRDVLARQ